jgi:hypothetical protein
LPGPARRLAWTSSVLTPPKGNGIAHSTAEDGAPAGVCQASELAVITGRIPTSTPVEVKRADDVAFWLLVP